MVVGVEAGGWAAQEEELEEGSWKVIHPVRLTAHPPLPIIIIIIIIIIIWPRPSGLGGCRGVQS